MKKCCKETTRLKVGNHILMLSACGFIVRIQWKLVAAVSLFVVTSLTQRNPTISGASFFICRRSVNRCMIYFAQQFCFAIVPVSPHSVVERIKIYTQVPISDEAIQWSFVLFSSLSTYIESIYFSCCQHHFEVSCFSTRKAISSPVESRGHLIR